MNRSMNPRRHVRLLVAIGLIAGLLPAMALTVMAAMSTGSIQGMEGWSGGTIQISTSVDQAVDQSGSNKHSGQGAWRISNKKKAGGYYGPFAGWVFGPGLPVSAGQPVYAGKSTGAGADQFRATLWFRSASTSPDGDGSNIEIDLGSELGDTRNSYLALTNLADGDDGLQLMASELDPATGQFLDTVTIAKRISRSEWHRLEIVANFYDGPANDTVTYVLDGVPLGNPAGGTTFTTLERWYEIVDPGPYVLSNRLFFRTKRAPSSFSPAFDDTAAQGFYFDDVSYSVADQSAQDSPRATYATGFEKAGSQASYATGFETGMSGGSIQGQEVWSGGKFDEVEYEIVESVQTVDKSGQGRSGQGAWRISNKDHNGNFHGWAFGPGLAVSAGQPSSGAGANQFKATLFFRSASATPDGSNIEIDLGTDAGNDRNNFLALTNRADGNDGGLQLRVSEPDGATGNFRKTAIMATGITRTEWHQLDIVANFHDGPANDTVEYKLDGVALVNPVGGATTFGTFEGFRNGTVGSSYALSNRLYFRSGAAPSAFGEFKDDDVQGFYFDDVSYSVASVAPDLTVAMSHAGPFTQGQIGAQFTFTVTNTGSLATSGDVTLTGVVPAGLTPTAAIGDGWTCDVAGATVTCRRSDVLAPGASYSPITVTVKVAANAPGSVTSTSTISGGGDVDDTNNKATDVVAILEAAVVPGPDPVLPEPPGPDPVLPEPPGSEVSQVDLSITNTDGRKAYTPGAPISYTITVTNLGPSSADGFGITNTGLAMITGVSVDCMITGIGYCGTSGSSGDSLIVTGANLAAGAGNALTLTVSGTVSPDASGPLVNMATVSAGAGSTDVNPGNNAATDTDRQRTGEIREIAGVMAYDPAFLGGVSVAVGDVMGDGELEIITGAGPGGGPHVRVWSLVGGALTEVAGFYAYDPAFLGGVSVAVGDVTGDGLAEIITGTGPVARRAFGSGASRIRA